MTAGLPAVHSFARPVRSSAIVAAGFLVAVLAGCGGGGGDQPAAAAAPSAPAPSTPASGSGTNRAPQIAGVSAGQVMVGSPYAFQPTASDADNNTLTFSVSGRPAWAAFSTTTGRLSGTPGPADVATYPSIVISVSDGTAQTALAAFSLTVVATATGSATLSWMPPTQNTDGTVLTDLSGYRIYWGTSPSNLAKSVTLNNPGLATYVVDQLTPATWYFATTALNAAGVESGFSNVASKVVL